MSSHKECSLSTDPLFIDKVRDIVGLCRNPPDWALVLCVDEKSQIQALGCMQPILPMMPGVAERRILVTTVAMAGHAVCSPEHRHRQGHWSIASAASGQGISRFPASHSTRRLRLAEYRECSIRVSGNP